MGERSQVISAGFGGGYGSTDRNLSRAELRQVEALIRIIRDAVGDDTEVAIDLNFNFAPEGFIRIARALEAYDLSWIELDIYDPRALLRVKESTSIPICSGESLYTTRGYRPYFELHSTDIAMSDVPWNGFTAAKKIADDDAR